MEYRQGEYLFLSKDTIFHYLKNENTISAYALYVNAEVSKFKGKEINLKVQFIEGNRIYYSCRYGAFYQDQPSGNLYRLQIPLAQNSKQSIGNILKMVVDRHKNIWIGTEASGIFKWDRNTNKVINISSENSIIKIDNIVDMALDDSDKIWIACQDKYYIFDIRSNVFLTSYGANIGLEPIGYDFAIHPNGMATFNNYPYIASLELKQFYSNNFNAPPIVTAVQIGKRPILQKPILNDTSLECHYNDAVIRFEFANLSLNNSQSNQYKIKLTGLDTAWTTTTKREISYTRLPSGKYTFMIQASNSNGNFHPKTLKIELTINPPFYKTLWFGIILFSLISSIIYYLYKQKIARILQKEAMKRMYEKKISEVEMKALRAQMNPHFIFNSLNSIQKFIFEKDEYAASQYLTKFSRLIRLILDHSHQDFVSIGSETDILNYYIEMEKLRFNDKFEFELIKDDTIQDTWMIPSMVIQPHVENAIWHGLMHKKNDCKLSVSFHKQDMETICVSIEDNGIGRVEAAAQKSKQVLKKKSYGSKISEDRIEHFSRKHNIKNSFEITDLTDGDGKGCGTRISIILPYKTYSETE
ncbi:MAG: histidine kinase [Saprospiraceae bacterium]|nr:histidine kinase [Saprospiraceae bacterium]